MLYRILLFIAFLMPVRWQTPAKTLTVAWVQNGDLMLWSQKTANTARIASGRISAVVLAPDGQHVAFTQRSNQDVDSLWLAYADGTPAKSLVTKETLNGETIVALDWLDASTLLFNTAQPSDVGQTLTNDLWRVDISSGAAKQILAPGKGGNFTISPDGQHIAIVRPGVYDGEQGEISIVNPLGQERQDVLAFNAVSTGSEYAFYPRVFWQANSRAFRVAVPDKDLIYNDTGLTTLWQVGVDGSQQQLGTVQASFFAQPQWSFDGQHLAFMRRVGDLAANQFEMVTAAGDGTGAKVYVTGKAGTLQFATWLPEADQFLYVQDQPGAYSLASLDGTSEPLPDVMFSSFVVADSTYVYVTAAVPSELRAADLSHPDTSTLIAQSDTPILAFDAVLS